VAHEVLDAALGEELVALALAALVDSVIRRPRVRNAVSRRRCWRTSYSKSSVSKTSASGRNEIVVPGPVGRLALAIGPCGRAADVLLAASEAVAVDLRAQGLRQRVDHGHADAVQAAETL
jgi:hypothetical protein